MNKLPKSEQFAWTMGFVGTGIGAGILFLPLQAGIGGIFCFLISCLIAFTFSYISHKVYAKLFIDSSKPKDYPQLVQNYLGNIFSLITAVLFFLLTISYLSIYVMGLNVGLSEYLLSLNVIPHPLDSTDWFPFLIIIALTLIISLNEKIIVKIMSLITFPLIILLLILSFYLIPHWKLDYLFYMPPTGRQFFAGIFYNIPILIFAGLFFPPVASMVLSHRKTLRNKEGVQFYSYRAIKSAQIVLLGFSIFFTFSCLMSTPVHVLKDNLGSNLNIMAILAKVYDSKELSFFGPLIAIVAIVTSFLGYYFGTKESAKNLIGFFMKRYKNIDEDEMSNVLDSKKITFSINIFLALYLWTIAMLNFNIEIFIGLTSAPFTALLLYIIPFIIFTVIYKYRRFRGFSYYMIIIGAFVLLLSVWIGDIITYLG
ncbi:MAG: hypothetical protein K9M56_02330 [Victivallales bacterium]|nr:hypothetical protein [Victivallales bacterium]